MKTATADLLFPRPRQVRVVRGIHELESSTAGFVIRRLIISLPVGLIHQWRSFRDLAVYVLGKEHLHSAKWNFREEVGRSSPQGYSLRIDVEYVVLSAVDLAALRYGLQTLRQLLDAECPALQAMDIRDWPDFPVRGVMLDISRDKVPTMSTLRALVRKFARWKMNQLQLYTEHTFAYRGHEKVWRGASPMTTAQIKSLDRYCEAHGIELVPNQNSFGHMERWLKHEPYRALAETSGPWRMKSGAIRDKPATLNPLDPRSIKLLSSLYDQLLPNFSSKLFNVGCDETFELGQGKSGAACRRRGVGNVYVDYLLKIYREVRRRRRTMMFWSDIVHEHPRTIRRLPKDAIALVWGYEADHPFARQCAELRRAGLPFYVCPGTSSWCSFSGRTENCMANLGNAAKAGLRHGAKGYLITDWGDYGHRQYLPVSFGGLMYGAGLAWCAKTNEEIDLEAAMARHALGTGEVEFARLELEIGRVTEISGVHLKNRTILFSIMEESISNMPSLEKLSPVALARLDRWLARLNSRLAHRARPKGTEATLEKGELDNTLRVLGHATARARLARSLRREDGRVSKSVIREARKLEFDIRAIMAAHKSLWMARNRPGGLASSLSYYERNLKEYLQIAGRHTSSRRRKNSVSTME